MVVHDFLPRVCGPGVVDSILQDKGSPTGPTVRLEFYKPENEPFIPVEFSVAAFRFGHSMIRPSYDLNTIVRNVPIFAERPAGQLLPRPATTPSVGLATSPWPTSSSSRPADRRQQPQRITENAGRQRPVDGRDYRLSQVPRYDSFVRHAQWCSEGGVVEVV
jgi:hypothetical protein